MLFDKKIHFDMQFYCAFCQPSRDCSVWFSIFFAFFFPFCRKNLKDFNSSDCTKTTVLHHHSAIFETESFSKKPLFLLFKHFFGGSDFFIAPNIHLAICTRKEDRGSPSKRSVIYKKPQQHLQGGVAAEVTSTFPNTGF